MNKKLGVLLRFGVLSLWLQACESDGNSAANKMFYFKPPPKPVIDTVEAWKEGKARFFWLRNRKVGPSNEDHAIIFSGGFDGQSHELYLDDKKIGAGILKTDNRTGTAEEYNLSIDSSSLVTVIIDQQDTLQFRSRTGSKAVIIERESTKGYLIDIQNWDAAFK